MKITPDRTVAEVVTENIKASHIFKKYGIDFCCGGGISIQKACEKKGVDFSALERDLNEIDSSGPVKEDFNKMELDDLIDYIIEKHHKYVIANIGLLLQYSAKVAKVHGGNNPELIEICRLFDEVSEELSAHLKKEEMVLFPFIKKMVRADRENKEMHFPYFTTVANPIKMMEDEHEFAGNIFKEIAELSNNYTPPEYACNTYRALFDKLKEFEEDLHQHIHLENNILHPKALILEKKLREESK